MVLGNTLSQRFGSNRRRTNGIRVENFTRFTTCGILAQIQKMMTESKCETEQFKGMIIFMPMYHDIDRGKRGNKEDCFANALRDTEYDRRFTRGHWSFLGPGSEKKWYETHVNEPDGEWDKTLEGMILNFAKSGHPIFRATSVLKRGELKNDGKGVKSIHFNGDDDTIELILRTIISVNQLSVYGAAADLCGRISQRLTRYGENRRE